MAIRYDEEPEAECPLWLALLITVVGVGGLYWLVVSSTPEIAWTSSYPQGLAAAQADRRPVLLYFDMAG